MQIKQPSQISCMDFRWDTMNPEIRKKYALDNTINTILFAKRCIPFYINHFSGISENEIEKLESLEEYAVRLPHVTKEHVSNNKTSVFIPDFKLVSTLFRKEEVDLIREFNPVKGLNRNYGTGGTTGIPTTVIHSTTDWNAMRKYFARSLAFDFQDRKSELEGLTAFGLYHGDHITNRIWEHAFALFGINMYSRASTKQSPEHNYELIQELRPNIIVGPSEDASGKQTKGITLDTILHLDARNPKSKWPLNSKENPDFKMILWSSMPMSEAMSNYILDHLGITYMHAHYGNTEVGSVSSSCMQRPLEFHVGYGSNLALIKSYDNQRLSDLDEEGNITFSKISGETESGILVVPSGMTLLNYLPGNVASITTKEGNCCDCSYQEMKRNTEIIKLHRRTQLNTPAQKDESYTLKSKNGFERYNGDVEKGKRFFGCQAD